MVLCRELDQTIPREGVLARPGEPFAELCPKPRRTSGDVAQWLRPRRTTSVFPVTLQEVVNIAIQDAGLSELWLREGVLLVMLLHDRKSKGLKGSRPRAGCGHPEG